MANTAYIVALGHVERTIPFWPRPWIVWMQRRNLRFIVRHAYETVPFYRRTMDELGLRPGDFREVSDLAKLPLIDAELVQRNVEDFLSTSCDDESREIAYTSGTTSGVRRAIYWDLRALLRGVSLVERTWPVVAKLAGDSFGRRALRNLIGETRAQTLLRRMGREGRMLHITPGALATMSLREKSNSRVYVPDERPHNYHLSPLLPLEQIAEQMAILRPRIVFSFGSFADHYFRFLAQRGDPGWLPRVWLYTGDTISPGGRELAEQHFGVPIHSSYNVTDMGRIGFECERRSGHHLEIDLTALRIIDPDGRELGPGEPGEIVVSSLRNRAMMLLNYRLGDRGALDAEPCDCGRSLPLLHRLDGRNSDMLTLSGGRQISSLALEGLFREALKPVLKVQIEQAGPEEVRLRLVPFDGASREEIEAAVERRADEILEPGDAVAVEFIDDIPAVDGKFPKVVRTAA
jgi:phenylacetate-CoA ligase